MCQSDDAASRVVRWCRRQGEFEYAVGEKRKRSIEFENQQIGYIVSGGTDG